MKHSKSFLVIALFLLLGSMAHAQTTGDSYYAGKWNLLIKGTPSGDVVLPIKFETKDNKFKGYLTNPETKETVEMTTATVDGDVITATFSMAGYDLSLVLTRKDADHANGKLMDMFDAEATRAKE